MSSAATSPAVIPIEIIQMIFSYAPVETRAVCRAARTWADASIDAIRIYMPTCYCRRHLAEFGFGAELSRADKLAVFARRYHIHKTQSVYAELYSDCAFIKACVRDEMRRQRQVYEYIFNSDDYSVCFDIDYIGVYEANTNQFYHIHCSYYSDFNYDWSEYTIADVISHDKAFNTGEFEPACAFLECGAYKDGYLRRAATGEVARKFPDLKDRIRRLCEWVARVRQTQQP